MICPISEGIRAVGCLPVEAYANGGHWPHKAYKCRLALLGLMEKWPHLLLPTGPWGRPLDHAIGPP